MISVVIPSAGTNGLIAGALNAAHYADERIVVTTDGKMTSEGAEAIAGALATVVDVPGPFNFSRAVNAGVAASSGDDIMLLNDDIACCRHGNPDWLRRLAAKRGDVLGVLLVDPEERTIEHAGVEFAAPGGMPSHESNGKELEGLLMRDVPILAVTAAAMLVRRRAWNKLKGFDERFGLAYNDTDFCLRAHPLRLKVVQNNTIRAVHDESSTRGKDNLPTEADYRLFASRHASFLRSKGIVVDAFAAVRHLQQLNCEPSV